MKWTLIFISFTKLISNSCSTFSRALHHLGLAHLPYQDWIYYMARCLQNFHYFVHIIATKKILTLTHMVDINVNMAGKYDTPENCIMTHNLKYTKLSILLLYIKVISLCSITSRTKLNILWYICILSRFVSFENKARVWRICTTDLAGRKGRFKLEIQMSDSKSVEPFAIP